ncbi:MAG: hypothetical protein A2V88_00705 [Elusimicrobia bacterium RBG_16_66_12]|nr:MAG: hypothetical protein A2V88_00705 [Elusimicrobia bacterium RBG_16_66_12]
MSVMVRVRNPEPTFEAWWQGQKFVIEGWGALTLIPVPLFQACTHLEEVVPDPGVPSPATEPEAGAEVDPPTEGAA